jgi:hypothetical protein
MTMPEVAEYMAEWFAASEPDLSPDDRTLYAADFRVMYRLLTERRQFFDDMGRVPVDLSIDIKCGKSNSRRGYCLW